MKPNPKSKNPHVEFSSKWAEWNRGFNKNFPYFSSLRGMDGKLAAILMASRS